MYQLISKKVEGYQLLVNKQLYIAILHAFQGKKVEITFREFDPQKTEAQLRYYHAGVVRPAALHFGEEHRKFHEMLKLRHNPIDVTDISTGEIIVVGGSTKRLGKFRFMEYLDRCITWIRKYGATIYSPDEYYERIEAKGELTDIYTEKPIILTDQLPKKELPYGNQP